MKYIRLVVVILLTIASSCRTDLCYDHFRELNMIFNYEFEWERDYGMNHRANWDSEFYGREYESLCPGLPEWVVGIRYSGDGRPEEHYLSANGGKIIIDGSEEESILLYNGDTEYILLSDMASLPDARASATERSRASLSYMRNAYPGSRSMNPPDVLYSAYIKPLPDVMLHESRKSEIKMQPLVFTYLVRYEFEYGIKHVALARGALGGMAESIYLRDGVTAGGQAIILYDCTVKPYGCESIVRSFGVPDFDDNYFGRRRAGDIKNRYTLNLEVMLTNKKTVEFNFDVTDQVASQPRGGVITVSGIRIEDEENLSGSGFDVELDGWGDHEEIELPVGTDTGKK